MMTQRESTQPAPTLNHHILFPQPQHTFIHNLTQPYTRRTNAKYKTHTAHTTNIKAHLSTYKTIPHIHHVLHYSCTLAISNITQHNYTVINNIPYKYNTRVKINPTLTQHIEQITIPPPLIRLPLHHPNPFSNAFAKIGVKDAGSILNSHNILRPYNNSQQPTTKQHHILESL